MKRLPVILTSLYVALLAVAVIPIFTEDDALSGVFAVILAAPWPMLLGKLAGPFEGSLASGLALVAVGGLINASLIFLVSRWLVRKLGKDRRRAG